MLRGSILQHSKLECPARLASCLCTLCFWTKLNFNRGGDPPSGGREGEKGKGGRAEGTCPRGALARSASPPLPPPPLGPRNPAGNPSLCFFSSSFHFRLNSSSAAIVVTFLLSLSLSPTFRPFSQRVASPRSYKLLVSARILKMLRHSR